MRQSPELTEFYECYLGWLNQGAPHQEPFSRMEGLCSQVRFFAYHSGYDRERLEQEIRLQFIDASLCSFYPFHRSGMEFSVERTRAECHLNPKRIAWVKEHANA